MPPQQKTNEQSSDRRLLCVVVDGRAEQQEEGEAAAAHGEQEAWRGVKCSMNKKYLFDCRHPVVASLLPTGEPGLN